MMDTRPDFRTAATWVGTLIAGVAPEQLDAATPCAAWTVRDLLGHQVAILRRLRAMAQGADPFTVPSLLTDIPDDQWAACYREALAAWEEAWSDDAVLTCDITAPFGAMPGAMALGGYIFETVTHGWDLATATGQVAEAPAGVAERALPLAHQILPADRRCGDIPFAAPVPSRPDAGPTEQPANWLGHAAA